MASRAKRLSPRARWESEASRAVPGSPGSGASPLLAHPPSPDDPHFLSSEGFPGAFPYTRGIQPTMYRGRLWTMRQYSGFAS
ncbi:MAG TPA: methylmalonyl-CoA mutase family protein, partial [Thermoplasmata archaeon]|nr:methylmalonyl-CoA mutase family protein [Thermoplasmata archaeon]